MATNLYDPIGEIDTVKVERMVEELEARVQKLREKLQLQEQLNSVIFTAREASRQAGRVERYVAGLVTHSP